MNEVDRELPAYLDRVVEAIFGWERSYGEFDRHPSLAVDEEAVRRGLDELTDRLKGNYPFFHPRYAGQMLKPPHPAAIAGYVAAMLVNPNNHALDGGPPTSEMEKEVVALLAEMLGFPVLSLGHLTGGGTVANLEAIFVARELNPGKSIAFSREAHYTHSRMCALTGVEPRPIETNSLGEMSLTALARELAKGDIGMVVATAGTTGSGAVDDIPGIVALCRSHDVRVHVDAAYGGFFRILMDDASLSPATATRLGAIAECDSVVIDPHKHGLQPYGCGAVLFRDPAVGSVYRHDSPYTYFTSDELHLGEISLECSRPGAAAAALWITLRVMPLSPDRGFGPVLRATRNAATEFAKEIESAGRFRVLRPPELDIVGFYPVAARASETDRLSTALFQSLMNNTDDPVFLSLLKVDAGELASRGVQADRSSARILRSVFMKPEHEHAVPDIARRIHHELDRMTGDGA